jgi:hypothetical protein
LTKRGTSKKTLSGKGEPSCPLQEEEHQKKPCQKEESPVCPVRKRNTKGNPVRKRRVQFALAGRETLVKYWQEVEHQGGSPCKKRNTKENPAGGGAPRKPCRRGSTKETWYEKEL